MRMIEEWLKQHDAILFDLDGTLIDTMPLHHQAYARVFAARGLTLTLADYMTWVGPPAREAIPRFLSAAGVENPENCDIAEIHAEKKQVFAHLLQSSAMELLPAANLLEAARGRRKLGLVSSGNRVGVHAIVSAMGWRDVFDVIVSGDDVTSGKPHPEPYLKAAEILNVNPKKCLVVEDAAAGFESARAAGMTVLDATRPELFR